MSRHSWYRLDIDERVSFSQIKRNYEVCTKCGLEKDTAARNLSWVVGFRPYGGRRVADTYLKTPPCDGRFESK